MTCRIVWKGHALAHLDKVVNIKGHKIVKGQEIEVPATVAGSLKRDYPDSVEVRSGDPVTPGSSGDPVARLKAAKRELRTDVAGLLGDVPVLPEGLVGKLLQHKKDEDPRKLVTPDLRPWVAIVLKCSGRVELAQKLLVADGT